MEAGCIVRVIKDFLTTTEGELCINAGEVLQVVEAVDRIWVRCRTQTREGLIPAAHIHEVPLERLALGERIFVLNNDFQAEQEGDLSLKRGTVVIGTDELDASWCRGRTQDGLCGTFPPSYCWELDATNYISSEKAKKHKVEKFAKVLHSMNKQLPEEIDLAEGDIVKIVEIIDKDWYRGEIDDRSGIFPASFVRIVDAFPGDAPPALANVRPYVDAAKHKNNEYLNTKNTFGNLDADLKAIGQQARIQSVIPNGFDSHSSSQAPNPVSEIFQDDYFKQNLPSTYGAPSKPESSSTSEILQEYNPEQSMFGNETAKCSKGFQEMSRNLSLLGGKRYYSQPASETPRSMSVDYGALQDNLTYLKNSENESSFEASPGIRESLDYNKVDEGFHQLGQSFKKSQPLTEAKAESQKLDYSKLSEGMSSAMQQSSKTTQPSSGQNSLQTTLNDGFKLTPDIDYNKAMANLFKKQSGPPNKPNNATPFYSSAKIFDSDSSTEASRCSSRQISSNSEANLPAQEDASEHWKYQNVTCETVGYTGDSVNVRPYAIAKYNFVAEFDNELGLQMGEIVHLNRYVDNEWLQGEIDGQTGIFPINYVNIIVDCKSEDMSQDGIMASKELHGVTDTFKSTCVTVHKNLVKDTYHNVLYNFSAQMDGDITVSEGEVVLIVEQQNEDWVVVENSIGDRGTMPGNHLEPKAEFEGKVLFDIERLMSYRSQKEKHEKETRERSLPPKGPKPKPDPASIKAFDPLCSPDGEMIRIEEELEKRVREPKIITAADNSVTIKQDYIPARNTISKTKMLPKPPRDLESLITSNLSKFRDSSPQRSSTNPFSFSMSRSDKENKVEISSMVLDELRGKNRPPEQQAEGNLKMPLKQQQQHSEQEVDAPTPPPRPSTKRAPAPPKPPPPRQGKVKSPAPKPPKPPPPQIQDKEPLYSQINKPDLKKMAGSARPSAPARPSRPPLRHANSLPARSQTASQQQSAPTLPPLVEASIAAHQFQVEVDVHSYDTPDSGSPVTCSPSPQVSGKFDQTPTNEDLNMSDELFSNHLSDESSRSSNKSDPIYADYIGKAASSIQSESIYSPPPNAPRRTSSIGNGGYKSKMATEIIRSYMGPPQFPPDKKSPMSPPPSGNPDQPPVIESLPCRSNSVMSSMRSKSMLYATVPSERGFSPAPMSSLNHSYETLNMSESNEPVATPQPAPRRPLRPAPPVPVKEQFESSKEKLFNQSRKNEVVVAMDVGMGVTAVVVGAQRLNNNRQQTGTQRRNLRQRKIHSLKRQIQIKESMLETASTTKEQLLRELDMYQEIAVAKGVEYDFLNRKMDNCQESIEKLSDEIQRLQACLADEELKQEEDSVEETRRRAEEESLRQQLEAQRKEEERRKKEAKIKRNREHRENVISELLHTEREFCRDMRLTWQAFGLDTPELMEQRGVDVGVLFGNIKDVIDVSDRFLNTLQDEMSSKDSVSKLHVGSCFLSHADRMKTVYTEYCVNNDKAEQLLEKYESQKDVQKVLQKGVETLQAQVNCFNMGSILIKPVQRILKYPLILNQLIKSTELDHVDRDDLLKAATIMTDVASFINESKRRKDIVEKYKNEEDKTLTRRISKLNMHSIGKKSSRMSQKILNTMGMDPMTRDQTFDNLERRFSHLVHSVQMFSQDSLLFRDHLHDVAFSQFNIAENVAEFYREKASLREIERFRSAHRAIISTHWNQYNSKLDCRVVRPLKSLLDTFAGPQRLIVKRQDKYLDYSASIQKKEKNKEASRAKSLHDDLEKSRGTYEALNSQLLKELPLLLTLGTKLYVTIVNEFILLRKQFVGRVLKELLSLMDLPLLGGASGSILEAFLAKHSLVSNQIGRFNFSSKSFKTEEKKPAGTAANEKGLVIGQNKVIPQNAALRTGLRCKYAAENLFQAQELYTPKNQLDIGVSPGDLVGVITKKDPMGNTDRWFVDNGTSQGFIPSKVLLSIGGLETDSDNEFSMEPSRPEEKTPDVVHAYDDVADDPPDDSADAKKPVRKAPPLPQQPEAVIAEAVEASAEESAKEHFEDQPPEREPADLNEGGPEAQLQERRSHHSYEEIAASEVSTEPSQDLSPIYEEIHGGSRSTVSTNSSSSSSGVGPSASAIVPRPVSSIYSDLGPRGKFHYSLYAFQAIADGGQSYPGVAWCQDHFREAINKETNNKNWATDGNMLSLKRGQVVRVLQASEEEWWYVEDREGGRGYVPNLYLKLYPANGMVGIASDKDQPPLNADDEKKS